LEDYRQLEFVVPTELGDLVRALVGDATPPRCVEQRLQGDVSLWRMVVRIDEAEEVMDLLEANFRGTPEYRLVSLAIESLSPPIEDLPPPEPEEQHGGPAMRRWRANRQEIYGDVAAGTRLNGPFVAMVLLSTVVAAGGLMKDSAAIVIGAVVIAPLLGPNMALALATTLGDGDLAKRASVINVVGVSIALALSALLGAFANVDPGVSEVKARTVVDLSDIALALASGSAGALSITTGVSGALVGVMVAVALLPPLVVFGLLLGAGEHVAAQGAGILLVTNVVCVNLAGIATFLAQGIRPATWWEEKKARRARRLAFLLWTLLLAGAAALIVLHQEALL